MEFYVIPAYRRQGYGTAMFRRLHGLFASHGVKRLYLTADPVTGKPFWEWIGFQNTGERSPENGLSIYEMGIGNWPSETARSLPVRADPASPGHAVWLDRLYTQSREPAARTAPYRFRSGERFCRRAIPMNGITSSL